MKILTLLRHAKSGWDDPALRDFDRPLNRRGRQAAHAIGRAMRAENMVFDAVLASPAVRVVETLRDLRESYGRDLDVQEDQALYLASPVTLLDRLHEVDDSIGHLLVVGHNPGLEQLTLLLSGGPEDGLLGTVAEKYPTAALAVIRFEVEHWADVAEGAGTLVRFVRPRDLDPALGPDD